MLLPLEKFTISLACLFFLSTLTAQEAAQTNDIFKIGFLDPGFSYEKAVNAKQTVYVNAHFSTYLSFFYSSSLGSSTDFRLEPAISLNYRFYYNGKTRAKKEKFTERNSMNYLTPVYNVVLSKRRMSSSHYEETSLRPIHTLALSWGLQRNYNNRFSLDFSFGPGVLIAQSTEPDINGTPVESGYSQFTILSEISIGLWLNKKKKM